MRNFWPQAVAKLAFKPSGWKTTTMIAKMEDYEREVLYPLATKQVEIDLDDGVKVNYVKFGTALKKIVGLDATED